MATARQNIAGRAEQVCASVGRLRDPPRAKARKFSAEGSEAHPQNCGVTPVSSSGTLRPSKRAKGGCCDQHLPHTQALPRGYERLLRPHAQPRPPQSE